MILTKKVQVKNRLGLHIRPATAIVQLLQNCNCNVTFTYEQETVNAKSILNILMLAAEVDSKITIMVEGEDANVTMDSLITAFENRFGEK